MADQSVRDNKNKKGFFARLLDKLDGKMKNAAEKKSCCCSSDNDNEEKDSSCC